MEGMSERLRASLEPGGLARVDSELEHLEGQITEIWGYVSAVTYRFLVLVGEYDRRRGCERHGLVSTAQWLNWQCGIDMATAQQKVRTARALESLPKISEAFARGEISYSKVRAMTRVATAATESVLLNVARHGTAAHVEKLVRKYRWTQRRDAAKAGHEQHLNREVHSFYDDTGTFVLHARLPAEIGAVVLKALQVAADRVRAKEPKTERAEKTEVPAETRVMEYRENLQGARRADALRLMAETFLATTSEEIEGTASGDRYQLVVHIDQAVLTDQITASADEPHRSELDTGPALALDTARRLGCDCSVVGIVDGPDGQPLDIGRKSRIISDALRRALRSRDGGCRFPGCCRTRFTDGHHVKHWADGGETKLSNIVTLCTFHHTLVHEGGFGVAATDDGVFVFTRPDGRRIAECGTPSRVPATAAESFSGNIAAVRTVLRTFDGGLDIDSGTSRCRWLGETMDYSQAIEGIQFLRDRAARDTALPAEP